MTYLPFALVIIISLQRKTIFFNYANLSQRHIEHHHKHESECYAHDANIGMYAALQQEEVRRKRRSFTPSWYGQSDGEVEDLVNNCLSFSRFVGFGIEDVAPDSTTVCRFRNLLVEADLHDAVLNEINRQLETKGVIAMSTCV